MTIYYNALLKKYKENGFVIVKNFFKEDQVKELDQKVQNFLTIKAQTINNKRDVNFTSNTLVNTMHDINKYDRYFEELGKKKNITQFVANFLESDAEFRKCEIFAKPAKVGLASPFHQDNYLWALENNNGLTVWIALDHVSEKNGGLTYVEGSHKLGLLEHEPSFAPGTSQMITKENLSLLNKENYITPNLNPGDILIHHCLIVHGSNVNKSDTNRRGLTIQYKDKKTGYNLGQLKKYEKSLEDQIKKRS